MVIGIVNYGMGNLLSVKSIVDFCGADVVYCEDAETLQSVDALVLPGVGAFHDCMKNLHNANLIDPLHDFALVQKRPILGICLGMQVMARTGLEHGLKTDGLGWFQGCVRDLDTQTYQLKKPHMGYNQIEIQKPHDILNGISNGAEFYFVHSYHLDDANPDDVLTTTEYGQRFISGVARGNIMGLQFHPEKSHDIGITIFDNFIAMIEAHI